MLWPETLQFLVADEAPEQDDLLRPRLIDARYEWFRAD